MTLSHHQAPERLVVGDFPCFLAKRFRKCVWENVSGKTCVWQKVWGKMFGTI
ncbi:MAG: hypothetical protein LBF22_01365 [Deltaproteobacteria bacterium]|nr:hypothetical protein [Deltaproteobacteria bacterium]